MSEGTTWYCGDNCNHTGPHRYRSADTPDPRPFSEEGWPEGSVRDEWNVPRPVSPPTERERLAALLTNRQMPDSSTLTLTLGELRDLAAGVRLSGDDEGLREALFDIIDWTANRDNWQDANDGREHVLNLARAALAPPPATEERPG